MVVLQIGPTKQRGTKLFFFKSPIYWPAGDVSRLHTCWEFSICNRSVLMMPGNIVDAGHPAVLSFVGAVHHARHRSVEYFDAKSNDEPSNLLPCSQTGNPLNGL